MMESHRAIKAGSALGEGPATPRHATPRLCQGQGTLPSSLPVGPPRTPPPGQSHMKVSPRGPGGPGPLRLAGGEGTEAPPRRPAPLRAARRVTRSGSAGEHEVASSGASRYFMKSEM